MLFMARQMRDPVFRQDQYARRYDPHIAPVNRYVDELATVGRGWLPYVAPLHGGIDARVLSILRDPGPATQASTGSGFLCIENDDPSAELQCDHLAQAGLTARDLLPWNAYPWYIDRQPERHELVAGLDTIAHLLQLAPGIRVVILQGGDAKRSWKLMERTHGSLLASCNLTIVETLHPSPQALFHPDPAVREQRRRRRYKAFEEVAAALNS